LAERRAAAQNRAEREMDASVQQKKSIVLPIALGILGALLALHLGFAAWLRIDGRFPFRTQINGVDVSLRRASEVQRTCMDGYYPNMSFTIRARDAQPYAVIPESFDFSDAARVESFLPKNTLTWPCSLFTDSVYTTSDGNAIDKLAAQIEALSPAFRERNMLEPENAYLAYNEAENTFSVVPETAGSAIDTQKFESALTYHILYGSGDFDLSAEGVYRSADIRGNSAALLDVEERLNRFLAAEVVYEEGDLRMSFPARTLVPYLRVDRDTLDVSCDTSAAAADGVFDAFAAELAAALDSDGGQHDFVAHDGSVIPVTEKTWREKLDVAATTEALAALDFEDYCAAEDAPLAGTLVWERAALDALTDYVEVDLTNQRLYLYTGGELALESPIVSGCVAQRHTTPGGAFSLIGKYRNVTLTGPGYESFVRYWMPFNNKIGLHDASWRGSFGGMIYLTNGSHGCINLPRSAAETLFNTIDEHYAIVCYWRPSA